MAADKHPDSVPALLTSLRDLRVTNPKAVRATVHFYPPSVYANNGESSNAAASSSKLRTRKITSWKMTEHMYFNASNPFPTLARGLFTEEIEEDDPLPAEITHSGENEGRPKDRIVARGYDKFFNIDEVEWTNWSKMQVHTQPPYHLTLKSNGCLILISALSPTHLVVASKHSLGTTIESDTPDAVAQAANGIADLSLKNGDKGKKGNEKIDGKDKSNDKQEHEEARAHAEVGREWVRKTLASTGKTEAELAKRLWDGNMTAVLELCDDSFEEHVIATPAHWTGLHLHGLNHNTPHFSTATPVEVTAFAKEFGFIETKYVELQTLDEVKSFTDEVSRTGSWEGDMIEGFVVRCTVKDLGGKVADGKPPYRPGAPFFFKVKFDEPYLLYRQWREITRVMLPLLEKPHPETEAQVWKKVRSKTKRPEVGVYAEWCGQMMQREPELFDNYDKGVVRVRERFLAWTEGDGKITWDEARAGKGKKVLGKVQQVRDKEGLPKKWLLVPVAVPGCGKTLIGVALSKLFGFGHTQSDDVTTKRTAPTFLKNITALLKKEDVVYADRNNHINKHYDELSNLANDKQLKDYNLRLVGIVWDIPSQPYHRLLRVCSERVVARGDNHQTLRPDPTMEAEHEHVVGQFLRNFTSPDPALFDSFIDVKVVDTPREALGKIVDGLVQTLAIERPTEQAIDEALNAAADYKVTTPYHQVAKVGKPIRYFGLAPEIDLTDIVEHALSTVDHPAKESAQAFFDDLKAKTRVTTKPHVTLSHEKNVQTEIEALGEGAPLGPHQILWETCKALAETKYSPIYEFNMTHLAWDDRVMTLALGHFRPLPREVDKAEVGETVPDLEAVLPQETRTYLHVTVGTKTEEIPAFESRGLVKILREAVERGEEEGEADEVVEGGGKVRWVRVGPIQGEGRVRGMF
ncbi:hypothetical protein CI109_103023 [Kwoniella shandongensis]|uniref:Uncharacterized protein n=1 Tax=Kwoniella shandongensis TaxID=1734106 RepID=A0A5M6CE07_9TREE|nr:uncharacterized protein CI109_000210 [Kwoniella shandongensis]KAA5531369.1 hypothetical protein CI109_000210 [Kwoniella shandongensis]